MCDICDHNYQKLYGGAAFKAAISAGGINSPWRYFNCRHTDEQKASFKELIEKQSAHDRERGGREIL